MTGTAIRSATGRSRRPPAVDLSITGATLTLTLARPGAATVTVTAQDPGGLAATQAFMVTTTDRQARGVVEDTLAAMGRGHLASVRATLGRRVETTGQEASQVRVAGLQVPLGTGGVAAAGQAVAERWIMGLAGDMPSAGSVGSPAAALGMAGGAPFGASGPTHLGGGASSAISGVSPLGGGGQTDFLLALGSGQAGGGPAQGQPWTVWGQLDVQAFAGERSPAARYAGDLRTTYVGVDARLRERWLAGVAVSHSRGDGDWNFGSATGRLSTTLTSVQPYLRWSDGGTTIWATGGGGSGSAEHERMRPGLQEESDPQAAAGPGGGAPAAGDGRPRGGAAAARRRVMGAADDCRRRRADRRAGGRRASAAGRHRREPPGAHRRRDAGGAVRRSPCAPRRRLGADRRRSGSGRRTAGGARRVPRRRHGPAAGAARGRRLPGARRRRDAERG